MYIDILIYIYICISYTYRYIYIYVCVNTSNKCQSACKPLVCLKLMHSVLCHGPLKATGPDRCPQPSSCFVVWARQKVFGDGLVR